MELYNTRTPRMTHYFKITTWILLILLFASHVATAQYKYTRYSVDINGGFSFPKTSIKGSAGAYSELGFRLATSRYLSGRISFGYGALTGSQKVTNPVAPYDDVRNYTEFDATYYYFSGSGLINLERIFKLRDASRKFNRLNMFLVIGAGYMYPDIKVRSVFGQFKNYKENVRFIHNNFGLDFKYFLSNKFDLNFGAEYKLVQTYYLDGAFSDKVLDGFFNGYVGLSYNIGANADKKHMEWFNLDGQIDVIYEPFKEEPKKEVPIVKEDKAVQDSLALLDDKDREREQKEFEKEQQELANQTDSTNKEKAIDLENTPDTKEILKDTTTYKKVGRHTDIRYERKPEDTKQPDSTVIAKGEVKPSTKVITNENLNEVKGVVEPLGKYNVIVGTYAGPKYAYYFRDQLRKAGFQVAIFKNPGKSKMHRVAVYFGNDRSEANRQLRRYMAKFNKQAWIHIYDKK